MSYKRMLEPFVWTRETGWFPVLDVRVEKA